FSLLAVSGAWAGGVSVRAPLRLGPSQSPAVVEALDQRLSCVWMFAGPDRPLTPERLLDNLTPLGAKAPVEDLRLPAAQLAALHIAVDALAAPPERWQALSARMAVESGAWRQAAADIERIRAYHEERGEPGPASLPEAARELSRRLAQAGSPNASPGQMDAFLERLFDTGPTDRRGLVRRLRAPLEKNTFTRHRGLDEYGILLGREFMADVVAMGRGDHLILPGGEGMVAKDYYAKGSIEEGRLYADLVERGKGRGAKPGDETRVLEFLERVQAAGERPASEKASIDNVAYRGEGRPLRRAEHGGRYRRFVGKLFERIPNKALKPKGARRVRVADVQDALLYTPEPTKILSKYLSLIGEDGVLYLYLGSLKLKNGLLKDRVITPRGEISFVDWLRSLPGISARIVRTRAFGLSNLSMTIRRTGRAAVPRLRLVEVRKTVDQADQADKVRVFLLEPR
ncbi:MAG TPA: hypothetical protein VNI01_16205, partial [Elusimicrobiota bacterium]|nr:hypothetical protein [Elusimicrobiota bacterium]